MLSNDLHIEKVIREERPKLFNFIRKQVMNAEEAEDLLQDVLYQFAVGYEEIRSFEKAGSWLFAVAKNKVRDYFRRKRSDAQNTDYTAYAYHEEDTPLMLQDILPSIEPDPEQEIMRSLILEKIEEALGELPPEQRDVFILNEFEDMSFREIAGITGEPMNTLISRKHYAVLYLRKHLQELYNQIK